VDVGAELVNEGFLLILIFNKIATVLPKIRILRR